MQSAHDYFYRRFILCDELAQELGSTNEQIYNLVRIGKLPKPELVLHRKAHLWNRKEALKALALHKSRTGTNRRPRISER